MERVTISVAERVVTTRWGALHCQKESTDLVPVNCSIYISSSLKLKMNRVLINRIAISAARKSAFSVTRSASSKVFPSAAAAVEDIKSGSTLLVGGFGLCGIPEDLIAAVKKSGPT